VLQHVGDLRSGVGGVFGHQVAGTDPAEADPLKGPPRPTVVPVDVNSGDYKGEPQMRPLTIVKEIGASSPQLVQAALHNEVIGEVIIQSMGRAPDGKKEVVKQKITLKDVKIVSHRQYMDKSAKESGGADVDVLEEVGFRFGEIQIENPEAGTATSWSWKTPNRTK